MLLNGSELAGFIKAQQAASVRSLQYTGKRPKLAIVQSGSNPASEKYIQLKKDYGHDIGVEVEHIQIDQQELLDRLADLNSDKDTGGIIVQLPLPDGVGVDEVLNNIAPQKDVDGLGESSRFDPAAPIAVLWLLSGYDIDLDGKQIGIVGQGRLVGAPLREILKQSGHEPIVCDEDSGDLEKLMAESDIVITATGQPGLITADMVRKGQVVIDAGTARSGGKLVGDVDQSLYGRRDIKISPVPGGVGPLTVCALFGNLIEAFKLQLPTDSDI